MENIRTYLVSFSNSRSYLLKDTQEDASRRLAAIENSLREFLAAKFPENDLKDYITPQVEEVTPDKAGEYDDYADLDASAVDSIKKELEVEIMNFNDNRKMDLDAPFADVDAQAADVTESLANVL
ncbi:MAG: hypothetical protein K2K93_08750 [Muribaculaceae bacterium]|nr:hypothetical protein [Muribaculaceae bacterium]